jgi:hypothetical protein
MGHGAWGIGLRAQGAGHNTNYFGLRNFMLSSFLQSAIYKTFSSKVRVRR